MFSAVFESRVYPDRLQFTNTFCITYEMHMLLCKIEQRFRGYIIPMTVTPEGIRKSVYLDNMRVILRMIMQEMNGG